MQQALALQAEAAQTTHKITTAVAEAEQALQQLQQKAAEAAAAAWALQMAEQEAALQLERDKNLAEQVCCAMLCCPMPELRCAVLCCSSNCMCSTRQSNPDSKFHNCNAVAIACSWHEC